MGIAWSSRLAVGVDIIDEQHQELFRRVNALLAAMESRGGREEVGKLVAYLGEYVVDHFAAEEGIMASHRYPETTDHVRQHQGFIRTFRELKAELDLKGPSLSLAVNVNRVVCGWLRDHIGNTDRALGQFLKSQPRALA